MEKEAYFKMMGLNKRADLLDDVLAIPGKMYNTTLQTFKSSPILGLSLLRGQRAMAEKLSDLLLGPINRQIKKRFINRAINKKLDYIRQLPTQIVNKQKEIASRLFNGINKGFSNNYKG